MIENSELPIGLTMELSQHSDILVKFSNLPDEQRNQIINGAKNIHSKNEMRNYVESMFQKNESSFF